MSFDAGNVGPRSAARCVDTVSESGAQVIAGTPCGGVDCSSAPASALLALLGLFARRARPSGASAARR